MTEQMEFDELVASAVKARVKQRTPVLSPAFTAGLLQSLPERPLIAPDPRFGRARRIRLWVAAAFSGVLAALAVYMLISAPAVQDTVVDTGSLMFEDLLYMPGALLNFLEDLGATIAPSDMIAVFLAVITPVALMLRGTAAPETGNTRSN